MIEELSRARQAAWAAGDFAEATRLTRKLEHAYEEKRINAARVPGRDRKEIVRRARIESELERLISR